MYMYISLSPVSEYVYISSLLTTDVLDSVFWWTLKICSIARLCLRDECILALVRAPFNVASLALHF